MVPRYPGWFSATFSGTIFSRSDPHVVGNGDLLGLWPILGRGHLEKLRARAENRKTQFPRARRTFGGEIRPLQKFLLEIAQLFYIMRFGRPHPQGREIAKYWFFKPFWPRAALGTWINSGPKTEKHNFPELSPENCATFLHFAFWPTGPLGAGNRKILVFKALLA